MRPVPLLLAALSVLVPPGAGQSSAADLSQGTAQEDVVLGRASSIEAKIEAQETVVVEAGTRLRQAPRADAPVLDILAAGLELPVLETRSGWWRVQYGSLQGWIARRGGKDSEPRPRSTAVVPDPRRIEQARELLGSDAEPGQLGPFVLLTDVRDRELIGWLAAVAHNAVATYRDRFALDPGTAFPEHVVLFADKAPFRRFQSQDPDLAVTHSEGFSSPGLAALYVGAQPPSATASVLIHEITHLLNRRVFKASILPWLDEGLADDLAYCELDPEGRLKLGTLTGEPRVEGDGTQILTGARAHLAILLAAWNSPVRPPLAALPTLTREDFLTAGSRSIRFAQSAFFIRLLLDETGTSTGSGFRTYLEQTAASELAHTVSLWEVLGLRPEELERPMHDFLIRQAAASRVTVGPHRHPDR